MTTFKEITHFHIGCLMQSVVDGQRFTHTVPWDSNNSHYKPILIPMDKMSEADIEAFWDLRGWNAKSPQFTKLSDIGRVAVTQSSETAWLLSRRYNVFNLPPEEFIDATTLNPNPYEQ